MDFLPNEVWDFIFSFLKRNDRLNCRTVCRKLNTISLASFNWSHLKIGFRNNEDTIKFCEMMQQSVAELKFRNFFFDFFEYSISVVNLKKLMNEIGSYATSCYISIYGKNRIGCTNEGQLIKIILNATPNLRILHMETATQFPEPSFHSLKNLKLLTLTNNNRKSQSSEYRVVESFESNTLIKWIEKAPSLKTFHSNLESIKGMSKYYQFLRKIPQVWMHAELYFNQKNYLRQLSMLQITKLRVKMGHVDGNDRPSIGRALNLFLEKQSQHLQTLQLDSISQINLTLPFLPKLEIFETFAINRYPWNWMGNLTPFHPNIFKNLQKVNLNYQLSSENQNPFLGGEYPTVTKVIVGEYSIQNWTTMFPNVRKFRTSVPQLDLCKHILANLPTKHHLVLSILDAEVIKYVIDNPSSVSKIEIMLEEHSLFTRKLPGMSGYLQEYNIKLWNALTGHAKVGEESIFHIKETTNTNRYERESGLERSIADIKNLWKLRGFANEVLIKALAYLSQREGSFVSLKKFILSETTFKISNTFEFNLLYLKLKNLPTWNSKVQIRNSTTGTTNNIDSPAFSKKNDPKVILDSILNR